MSIPIELTDQNPWWRNPEAIYRDKYLVALQESRVPWDPRLKYKFDLNTDVIYTLRGPRQVGKTTLLKDIIRELLESKIPQRNIFYFTCDLIDSPRGIVEIVSSYLDTVRPSPGERAYILLDEISSVKDWQKAIKYLVDRGRLTTTTVILTGSHSLDIKKASEKLPGRRGLTQDTPDKIMLTMKFAEYVETLNKDIRKLILEQRGFSWNKRKALFYSLLKGDIPEEIKELSLYSKELMLLFQDYLLTGGIAKVIDEYLKHKVIPEGIYKIYVDVVLGDLAKWNKRETYLRQVVSQILKTLGTPVGWNTIKKGTDIASHNTVAEYVDTLTDSFVLLYLYHYDVGRRAPNYRKAKKIHFHDSFFLHAMNAWTSGRDPFELSLEYLRDPENLGILVEGVVADHLVRLAFHLSEQKQFFAYENTLYYWRGKKDREVDFVLNTEDYGSIPIEVKYQPTITKRDKYGAIDFMKNTGTQNGLILSKETLNVKRNITTIPVWLFLLLV